MTGLVHFLVTLALLRVCWAIGKAKLGIRPRVRRGRTALEIGAAGVGAWWLSRRADRRVEAQAALIPPGSEVQVHVRGPHRYPHG